MHALATIDNVAVPLDLTGATGRNRARGHRQIAADDDRSAVLAWLGRYLDSPATLASYRKESERLLLWCLFERRVALSDLTHEDLMVFESFLARPEPAERWVMAPGLKAARSSPGWRPFAGPLGVSSVRQAMIIINGLFIWLVEAGYLAGNPLALRRRPRKQQRPKQLARWLPEAHWKAVRDTIQAMPTSTERQSLRAARARWIFSLLYSGGVRVSELCDAKMSCFLRIMGSDGKERWWLEVVGKGSKVREIPATDELMEELRRYRTINGLSPLPKPGEDLPLLLPLIGAPTHMTRTAVYELVKDIVREAAAAVRALGPEHEAAAAHLERASPHWMRHTAGSALANKLGATVTRDNLGHDSIETSNIYIHTEDEARHDATNAAHSIGWS